VWQAKLWQRRAAARYRRRSVSGPELERLVDLFAFQEALQEPGRASRVEGLRTTDDVADASPAEVEVVLFLVIESLGVADRGAGDIESHLDDLLGLQMPELTWRKDAVRRQDGLPTWAADTVMPVSSRSSRTAVSR